MSTVRCSHCGLPHNSNHPDKQVHFCCSGCEMVYEINNTSDTGETPSNLPESLVIRFIIAAVLTMPLMLIAAADYWDQALPTAFHIIGLVGSTTVLLLLGKEYLLNFQRDLKQRKVGLVTLIFIGILSSYSISLIHFSTGHGPVFFETTAMLMVFYSLSLIIDIYLKNRIKAQTSVDDTENQFVEIKGQDDTFSIYPVSSVERGDILRFAPYQPLSVDGVLTSASALISTEYISGEPAPSQFIYDDEITAGSFSTDISILVRASTTFKESSLQRYLRESVNTAGHKHRLEEVSEHISRWLIAGVTTIAATTFFLSLYSYNLNEAIFRSLAVLLIGCPCTFAIATPAAFWITQRNLFNHGIILKKGTYLLDVLRRSRQIVLDKTGTLTDALSVESVDFVKSDSDQQLIVDYLLSLEVSSEHPVARAIQSWAHFHDRNYTYLPLTKTEIMPGEGVKAYHEGSDTWVKVIQQKGGEISCYLNENEVARITLTAPWKDHLFDTLQILHDRGFTIHILTGDRTPRPELMNSSLIHSYQYGMTPNQKQEYVTDLKAKSMSPVIFVGDGVNDVGAMASSDASITLSNGSMHARSEGDVFIFRKSFHQIVYLLSLSKRAIRSIHLNFIWAVVYNIIGVALAAFGYLHPFFSVVIMIFSSLLVTINSLSPNYSQKK